MLGELEYLTLSAAARLGESAPDTAIRQELEALTQGCSFQTLQAILDRLEAEGLIATTLAEGAAVPQQSGVPVRMVRVTEEGLRAAASWYDRAWDD